MSYFLKEFNVLIPDGSPAEALERALEACTAEMNRTPILINSDTWKRNLGKISAEAESLTAECRKIAGWSEFRPNASADCVKVFEARGHEIRRRGKSISMDQNVLIGYAKTDELADKVIAARKAITKRSQLAKWESYALAGQAQSTWNQFGTPMGRYSCEDPAYQNRIVEIRETLIARPGYRFISLDLGQAEYVTWASLSGDPLLSEIFLRQEDLHDRMAKEILEAAPDVVLREVTPRQMGKTVNFAQTYQQSEWALAADLGIPVEQAEKIVAAWKSRAARAIAYRDETLNYARLNGGKIATYFGRERTLPDLRSSDPKAKREAEKTAWHHHNAGTAAELVKFRQLDSWSKVRAKYSHDQARIVLQMHDEVIFEAHEGLAENVEDLALTAFQADTPVFLPFHVEVRSGSNWLETSK